MKNNLKLSSLVFIVFTVVFVTACKDKDELIIPKPLTLEQNLSAYNIYAGDMSNLTPSSDFHLFELSSPFFSNYARKQRLINLPPGEQMVSKGNGIPTFPDGTILVKTFYYFNNETDESLGKKIIETRLLIKHLGEWNAAAYIWNDAQTDATLNQEGLETEVNWINSSGISQTINYRVPPEADCILCHESKEKVVPIGPSLRNLNTDVTRDGATVNQLAHLQSIGALNSFSIGEISQIPDYNDEGASLAERGRAYIEINCASCHQPDGWWEAAQTGVDFRYEVLLEDTGILDSKEDIISSIEEIRMPMFSTTVVDEEGLALVIDYINSL